jgi:hypothetical protein
MILIENPVSSATIIYLITPHNVSKTQTFDVNSIIDPEGATISGAQLNFTFNRSILRVNSIKEGDLFRQTGSDSFFYGGQINNSMGKAVNIFGVGIGGTKIKTAGVFFRINMTATGSGISYINISDVKISDPAASLVNVSIINASIVINNITDFTLLKYIPEHNCEEVYSSIIIRSIAYLSNSYISGSYFLVKTVYEISQSQCF